MECYQQRGDGDFARGIGDQLQRLCLPNVGHSHLDLLQVQAFDVPAEAPVDGKGDQYLASEREELPQTTS